jgi:cellulose synthase (UDP-forming)
MRSIINPRYLYGRFNKQTSGLVEWAGWDKVPVRLAAALVIALFFGLAIATPLSLGWQAVFGAGVFAFTLYIRRYAGTLVTLMMIGASAIASLRYLYWRFTETLPSESMIDMLFAYVLVAAECYALLVLLLGYVQTLWPLRRKPVPLPQDMSQWPTVDVFIPTYNEPLKVVKPAVLAAKAMDWPKEKLNIYILDDGAREEFREFAEAAGVVHLTRENNLHAKAGNINAALPKTSGDYIAFFDCDHIPTRAFLQLTMGWFLRDPKLALVQTPHHFLSPDPFERNLGIFRRVPNEGELFYGVIQDGNDLWNAAFFCGSCAVIKRQALTDIGGMAVDTVTEDAHTSLMMQRLGYNTAYISIPLAAGLATESLSAHIKQRIRWARGMAQILRLDNPFLGKGLKFGQRLCYGNAILHFFYGLPRIVFLVAPLSYLYFGAHIIHAAAITILAYALPHLAHATLTNSRIQGAHRHSFWAEVYEATLAWYILRPTLAALFSPRTGAFNVTAKGGLVEHEYFDWSISRPFVVIFLLNVFGLLIGIGRLLWWNTYETDTVILNLSWTVYNLIILGATLAVARESRQVRSNHRIPLQIRAAVRLSDGTLLSGETTDCSEGGVALHIPNGASLAPGNTVEVALFRGEQGALFPAEVVSTRNEAVALKFAPLTIEQESALVQLTLSRADAWVNWAAERDEDHPARGMKEIFMFGIQGIVRMFSAIRFGRKERLQAAVVLAAMVCALAAVPHSADARTMPVVRDPAPQGIQKVYRLSFKQLGINHPMQLRGVESEVGIPFSIRADEVVTSAVVKIDHAFSPALIPELSHLKVLLNEQMMGVIPVTKESMAGAVTTTVALDPRAFTDYNRVNLKFIGHYTRDCEDPVHSALWAQISNNSVLEITVSKVVQQNDLAMLPAPFFDKRDVNRPDIAFVFGHSLGANALHASGTIASWFGALSGYRGVHFHAQVGSLPDGQAVVFATPRDAIAGLSLPEIKGPTIAMTAHPSVSKAKLLLILGRNDDELKIAAQALALGKVALSGSTALVGNFQESARKPYDAPNWIPTDRPVKFSELVQADKLQVNGLFPDVIRLPFQMAPDLLITSKHGVPVELRYRYTPRPTAGKATLNISANDRFVEAVPLQATGQESLLGKWVRRLIGDSGPAQEVRETGSEATRPVTKFAKSVDAKSLRVPGYYFTGRNLLQFHYYFDYDKQGLCKDGLLDNSVGAVDGDSTIDFSGYHHYAALPSLAMFANSGFPFTRMADLSESAVVLPDTLDMPTIETYLVLMAKMGEATGYPATRMTLTNAANTTALTNKDLLVIGSAAQQPLVANWSARLPLAFENGSHKLQLPGAFHRMISHWEGRDLDGQSRKAGDMLVSMPQASVGTMMQIESPFSKGRAAVVVTADRSDLLPGVVKPLFEPSALAGYQGDLVLLRGEVPEGFTVGPTFHVGSLPITARIQHWLETMPLLLVLLAALGSLLLAVLLYRAMRNKTRSRLEQQ